MPAIFDPNTNITVFESGAIMAYICDAYPVKVWTRANHAEF